LGAPLDQTTNFHNFTKNNATMKAASLLRHLWVGGFFCFLFLAATGVAYANASNTSTLGKSESTAKQEHVVKQAEPSGKHAETVSVPKQGKAEPKSAEVKKEGVTQDYFSFSFLYYLFYKTNFAESTNNVLRSSLNAFISRLIG
jgi:hypothetical protein